MLTRPRSLGVIRLYKDAICLLENNTSYAKLVCLTAWTPDAKRFPQAFFALLIGHHETRHKRLGTDTPLLSNTRCDPIERAAGILVWSSTSAPRAPANCDGSNQGFGFARMNSYSHSGASAKLKKSRGSACS
jgi:hypothetical protein